MIFSVSNDGIQWTLDFGPDSVSIAVNDLDQNIAISSQEITLAAWQVLLSQRQDILNNHIARVTITLNQEGTMEMSSFQKTKSTQTSWSVFADRIEQVKKTKSELELIKIAYCFLDGHGNYTSNLVSFKIKSF